MYPIGFIKSVISDFKKKNDIVNKYNRAYHSTMKMKSIYVKSCTYTDFDKKNNK